MNNKIKSRGIITTANKPKPYLKSPKNVVQLKPNTDPNGEAVWINEVIIVL